MNVYLPLARGILLGCLLGMSCLASLVAQTVDPDYRDGYLYLKLTDATNAEIPPLKDLSQDANWSDLYALMQQYGVVEISRPFRMLRTPIFDRTYQLRFTQLQQASNLIEALASLPRVEYAEGVPLMRKSLIPNDFYWYLVDDHLLNVDAHLGWDLHTGGGTTVAIVDDAVEVSHPDLSPNVWVNPGEIPGNGIDDDLNGYVDDVNGYDVSDLDGDVNPPLAATSSYFSHGTHCAGIAGAATNNSIGVASIGHSCEIIGVKASPDTSAQFIYNAYDGVVYAIAAGADVISMSWGGGGFSSTAQNIFNQANTQGILLVAAAGNDNSSTVMYPAGYTHVIAVANLTDTDVRNTSSNYGFWVDVSAPGTSIWSTVANGSYGYKTGTSMACPQVAGLLSLMKSYQPATSIDDLEGYLLAGAENIDDLNPLYANDLGTGRINVHHSLLAMDYCLSAATNEGDSRIDEVVFAGIINNTTSVCETYTILPQRIGYLNPGTNMPVSLTLGSCGGNFTKGAKIYIDWNSDGDFTDPGEEVYSTGSVASATTTYTGSINVPTALSPTDTFRMRVVCQETSNVSFISPCGTYSWGETEDYLLTQAPPLCAGVLISTFPYSQDFESFPTCGTSSGTPCALPVASGWTNESNDDLDWTVDVGGTSSSGTGPSTDSVPGTSAGKYLYTEASTSGTYAGREARLTSPCFDLTGLSNPELTFAYHMDGSDMGTLHVDVNNGSGWQNLWSLTGDQGDAWRPATVSLGSYVGDTVKVRFRGVTGAGFTSDMAIDYVRVTELLSCGGTTSYTTLAGSFDDGSGPGNYSNNLDCRWHIDLPGIANSITLDFTAMDVQPGDQVRVYDGATTAAPLLGTFTGSTLPSTLTSSGPDMLVRFTTDGSGSSAGWAVNYQANVPQGVVYGYNTFDPTGQLPTGPCLFELSSPDSVYLIANQDSLDFLSGGCWVNGIWYTSSYFDTTLVTVNPATGARTTVGPFGNLNDQVINGLAYDPTTQTLFGVTFEGSLYTIDMATGAATLVGSDPANQFYINLACNSAGQLYSLNLADDQLYQINPTNGIGTAIGPVGYDANFAQDMEFDPATGTLYIAGYFNNPIGVGFLGTVNTGTGAVTVIDTFMNGIEITAFAIPGQSSLPPACSGLTTLTAPSGTFDDGSGPSANYGNNSSCTWLIEPTNAINITLSVNSLATELNSDFVRVYDGNSASAPLLATYSGQLSSGSVTSSGGALFVEFTSNTSITDQGWELSYNAVVNSNVLTYVGGQAAGAVGSIVSFPVRMTNFTDIVSFQGTMSLTDPTVGQFVSGTAGNFNPALAGMNAGNFNITNNTVTFSWNHPSITPTTIPNNEVMFTIDVQLTGSMGDSTQVCFGSVPTLLEVVSFDGTNFIAMTPATICGDIEILDEVALSGLIRTEGLLPLNQTTVDLSGGSTASMITGPNGQYAFPNLPAGGNYTVTPSKNLDVGNGVTTFDIIFVRQHVLGSTLLSSPYKIIAADVNGDNNVTTFDIIFMRQVILAITSTFPNGVPSWRTVPASHVFANPTNPFPYPESLSYSGLLLDSANQDFVAIKMGDVNETASNLRITRPDGTLTLAMLDRQLEPGEVIEVPLTVRDFQDILGYQFTVDFDPEALRFEGWHAGDLPDLAAGHFNLDQTANGRLATSWDDANGLGVSLAEDEVLFYLRFAVQGEAAKLSELLAINGAITQPEAYQAGMKLLTVESLFVDPADPVFGFALFQNKPNPYRGKTIIGYRLPVATPATLTIIDALGRVVSHLDLPAERGYHEVVVPQGETWSEGVYYYRLTTADGYTATRQMQVRN